MADNNLQAAIDWLKNPQRTQQVQGIGNTLEEAINNLSTYRAKDEQLWNQSFGNPQKPLQVTDQAAFNEMNQRTMAGPMSFAPVGMVVGRGVTPELTARANQLLNTNASLGRILQETGLVQVPTKDGFTWGKQISDAPLNIDFDKLKTTPYEGSSLQPLNVGDAISHPELFKLYPELQNMRLFKTDNQNAYYTNAGGGEIGIPSGQFIKESTNDPKAIARRFNEINSFAVHELSHAIQNLDKMPRGASIENFRGYGYQNVQKQADWTMKSLQDVTTAFLEKQGLTAPKDFKSFVQSVAYIKANGPKYLEDVGPESRKRIQAVLASDKADDLLDTFSRVEKAYAKINTNKNKATARYKNEAGEAQARAVEKQYLENNYKAPVTSFYDTPIENLQYRDPLGFTIK